MPNLTEDQKFQVAVANLITMPEEQPENLKKLFKRLDNLRTSVGNVEQALSEARESVHQLTENRSRMMGSVDTLVDLIKEDISPELIAKHGQKIAGQEGPSNGLPKAEAPQNG